MKLLSHYLEQQRKKHPEVLNWENYMVGDRLSYSYRDTVYDSATYPSDLHYHDYYELVVFEEGSIKYVCEGRVYTPKRGDVILIPPGKFHMSMIATEKTRYRRHVFYLYPSAFDAIGQGALSSVLTQTKDGTLLSVELLEEKKNFLDLLWKLKEAFSKKQSPLDEALALSYLIQIFCFLNRDACHTQKENLTLPESVLKIQRYIDQNFVEISSVAQIAEHFFYSREHVSRLFKKHLDTTVLDYVRKRRIAESQALLPEGIPITEIA